MNIYYALTLYIYPKFAWGSRCGLGKQKNLIKNNNKIPERKYFSRQIPEFVKVNKFLISVYIN